MTPELGLPKTLRLTKRREFLAMRGPSSLKTGTGLFTVVVKPNGLGLNRLGVTATRKVGKAAVRNRLKRLAREFFRLHQGQWPQGLDVLLIAKAPEAPGAKNHNAGEAKSNGGKPNVAKPGNGKPGNGKLNVASPKLKKHGRVKGPSLRKLKGPGEGSARRLAALMGKAASLEACPKAEIGHRAEIVPKAEPKAGFGSEG